MALQHYGTTAAGQNVQSFALKSPSGLEVRGISYGCRLTHLLVPSAEDGMADVLLGFDDLAAYEADTESHGAFVGRYAGRIENAAFELHGKHYSLTPGPGGHYLHGSLAHRVFSAEMVGENSVSLTYTSPSGEDGFPGKLWLGVQYTLTEKDELVMDFRAVSTADTYVNLTNHNYYNLAGAGNILRQQLWVNSGRFLEMREGSLPSGRVLSVEGAPFDFREEKPIGQDINAADEQLKLMGGYDHGFPLEKNRPDTLALAAIARDAASGRSMRVYTTQPSVHLYTANGLNPAVKGKGGAPMQPRGAFCLETQHYPNSPNMLAFPSTLLEVGDKYHQITALLFEW